MCVVLYYTRTDMCEGTCQCVVYVPGRSLCLGQVAFGRMTIDAVGSICQMSMPGKQNFPCGKMGKIWD